MIGLYRTMNRRPLHMDAGCAPCMEFGMPVVNGAPMLTVVARMSANDIGRRAISNRGHSVDEAP